MAETPSSQPSPVLPKTPSKLNVSLVKRQESSLLSNASCLSETLPVRDISVATLTSTTTSSTNEASAEVILRLGWKLRVHGYLSKFAAACGALALALSTIGYVSSMKPNPLDSTTRTGSLSDGLRRAHSAEWVGAVMLAAGLANIWVRRGRVSLLLAFAANLIAIVFAATGLCVSCVLLGLYFSQCNSRATTELLNASLLALFILLAQLSGLVALLTHISAYHPYRVFARANGRLRQQCEAEAAGADVCDNSETAS